MPIQLTNVMGKSGAFGFWLGATSTCKTKNCGKPIHKIGERELWRHLDDGDVRCMVGVAEPWPDTYEHYEEAYRTCRHCGVTIDKVNGAGLWAHPDGEVRCMIGYATPEGSHD
jgi:hypothetical protein